MDTTTTTSTWWFEPSSKVMRALWVPANPLRRPLPAARPGFLEAKTYDRCQLCFQGVSEALEFRLESCSRRHAYHFFCLKRFRRTRCDQCRRWTVLDRLRFHEMEPFRDVHTSPRMTEAFGDLPKRPFGNYRHDDGEEELAATAQLNFWRYPEPGVGRSRETLQCAAAECGLWVPDDLAFRFEGCDHTYHVFCAKRFERACPGCRSGTHADDCRMLKQESFRDEHQDPHLMVKYGDWPTRLPSEGGGPR